MTEQTIAYIGIPLVIMQDERLTHSQILLYGIIFSNSDDKGCCRMTNRDFSKLLNTSTKSVLRYLEALEKQQLITRQTVRDKDTNEVTERRIFIL